MSFPESRVFQKILVANRGEVACRIVRTARRMGIATVAVYSDADALSPHVTMADDAVRLGPAPAAESYLDAARILDAARATGADAIHPGYGFLSERESFARACEAAGIAFVGPPATAIAAMGDKIQSKTLAAAAGVNVVPGFLGEIADMEDAVRIAGGIGYPVMMKASAGGGGKGMRLARSERDLREGYDAVRREGLAGFGDDRILIEAFIESPRHIEIQVLGDRHGTILHLGERECSIQRRHQKVVEEAPSPFVSPQMRRAMGEQAVALARAVGYHSAGTVEFIVSGADTTGQGFHFLEMNTRLQVEHPVTEMVTGLDLVEEMIRVAAGETLRHRQEDIALTGWSVETRIYAEDPYRGFLPATGRLVRYAPPAERQGVRVDDGVREGGEISIFYDPMIAKLVTFGDTREAAIDRQVEALDRFELKGVGNNIDFLSALMQHERFRAGDLSTGFIAEEYPDGFSGAPATPDVERRLVAAAAVADLITRRRDAGVSGQLGGPIPLSTKRIVSFAGAGAGVETETETEAESEVEIEIGLGPGSYRVRLGGDAEPLAVETRWRPGQTLFEARIDDTPFAAGIERRLGGFDLRARGATRRLRVGTRRLADLARFMIEKVPPDLSRFLLCPMPGLLTQLYVKAGDRVEAGQPLAVVEAMKMENILRAAHPGVVASLEAASGDSLAVDQVILTMA